MADKDSGIKPPRLTNESYHSWKIRVLAYFQGLGREYIKALTEGPHVPTIIVQADIPEYDEGDEIPARPPPIAMKKRRDLWSEEDIKLVNVDDKVRSILVNLIPDEVLEIVTRETTTSKEMWDALIVIYEGTSEVRRNKTLMLVRQYELFMHQPKESIDERSNIKFAFRL